MNLPVRRENEFNFGYGSFQQTQTQIKLTMSILPLMLLSCGLLNHATSNIHLSKRTKVITSAELPCISIELGRKCFIAKMTKPIAVTIDIGVNAEKVSFIVKQTE